jgi:hypothetical protein
MKRSTARLNASAKRGVRIAKPAAERKLCFLFTSKQSRTMMTSASELCKTMSTDDSLNELTAFTVEKRRERADMRQQLICKRQAEYDLGAVGVVDDALDRLEDDQLQKYECAEATLPLQTSPACRTRILDSLVKRGHFVTRVERWAPGPDGGVYTVLRIYRIGSYNAGWQDGFTVCNLL